MQNGHSEPGVPGQSHKTAPLRRPSAVKRSALVADPPLSVAGAAAALLRAVENENEPGGPGFINRIVVTRTWGPRVYVKSSFVDWRNEAEARDSILADREREEYPWIGGDSLNRNPLEHPETAFRRGVQQGAHRVLVALQKAGVLDPNIERRIADYVGVKLFWWRYRKQRRLERHLHKDAAPWLELKGLRG